MTKPTNLQEAVEDAKNKIMESLRPYLNINDWGKSSAEMDAEESIKSSLLRIASEAEKKERERIAKMVEKIWTDTSNTWSQTKDKDKRNYEDARIDSYRYIFNLLQ